MFRFYLQRQARLLPENVCTDNYNTFLLETAKNENIHDSKVNDNKILKYIHIGIKKSVFENITFDMSGINQFEILVYYT